MFYNNLNVVFGAIGSCEQGYALSLHQVCYDISDLVLALRDAAGGVVVLEAFECSDGEDEALRYLASSMFSALHFLMKNSRLCTFKYEVLGDCAGATKIQLERGSPLVVFWEVPLRVMEAVGVGLP